MSLLEFFTIFEEPLELEDSTVSLACMRQMLFGMDSESFERSAVENCTLHVLLLDVCCSKLVI